MPVIVTSQLSSMTVISFRHGKCDETRYRLKFSSLFRFFTECNPSTRGHSVKFRQHFSRVNSRACSFANRCVDVWNSLDNHIVNARRRSIVVIKTIHVETEAKTEASGFKTEAEAQSSWSIFLADRTDGRVCATVLRFLSSVCDVMYCG